jgi:hypothetical protein
MVSEQEEEEEEEEEEVLKELVVSPSQRLRRCQAGIVSLFHVHASIISKLRTQ